MQEWVNSAHLPIPFWNLLSWYWNCKEILKGLYFSYNKQRKEAFPLIVYAYFAALRYWKDPQELLEAYESLSKNHPGALINQPEDLQRLPGGKEDVLVVVPMSGAVQAQIIKASQAYGATVIFAAYVPGNVEAKWETLMLTHNAAPTVMDCWSVLRRNKRAVLAQNNDELERGCRLMQAFLHFLRAKLLLVGEAEPWVISCSRDLEDYRRMGLSIEQIPQDEVVRLYEKTTREDGSQLEAYYRKNAKTIVEPTTEDLYNGARMAKALLTLMEQHQACGMALACFNLLQTGTNCCLGVSYINEHTPWVAACEGDLDSAVTMLMMKQLTKTKLWMANPGLMPGELIHFSHCTAPLDATCCGCMNYTLRSHHESGIGTSIDAYLPVGQTVTLCRISGKTSEMTVHRGVIQEGEKRCTCRTQSYVRLENHQHYLDTALGCHQVFAFEDITKEITDFGKMLGLTIL